MSETLPNVLLPTGVWVDLYAVTGIVAGVAIQVQNVGAAEVRLTVSATQPALDFDSFNIVSRENGKFLRNSTGDPGAWAFCPTQDGKLNVSEVATA